MKKIIRIAVIILLFSRTADGQTRKITYMESMEDFPNPERGFYVPSEGRPGHFTPLDVNRIKAFRSPQLPGTLSLKLATTLIYRGFLLDSFKNSPISAYYLKEINEDFATIRSAGMKAIVRFAYTNISHSGDCPDQYKICPPYGDAPPNIVLGHINQLKPLLEKNADVIAVLQMGFIGIWGENYFTDYFGDASTNGLARVMDSSWKDRNKVLDALLHALPKDRMVQVRTPQMKQKYVYGAAAGAGSAAAGTSIAFSGSDASRIGFHNDCFLSGPDDYGTFYDYGSSSTPRGPANETLRNYFMEDSRYVPVGGETCDNTFSPENDCGPSGHAETEMRGMHYSFLNATYNMDVINDWKKGGCIDSIKRSLGYRLVLRAVALPEKIKKSQEMECTISLENKGYAAPYNPRSLWMIFRNQATRKEYAARCKTVVQSWLPGEITISEKLTLPVGIPAGKYALFLNLPDPYPSLSKRPEYSIRLANENMWEEASGYNDLKAEIVIGQ
jgi:hypothetical protein